jgi:uncharacterized protein (TIGR02271 family)
MEEIPAERVAEIQGTPVYDMGGQKIGSVDEVFLDNDTGKPEWLGIGAGLLSSSRVLVPVHAARFEGDAIAVPYTKEQVKGSPEIKGDELSQQTEQELYAYYGLDYSETRSDSGLPEGAPSTSTTTADVDDEASVTRSEEDLWVGTRSVEASRIRLRKWVETEPVTANVEVQHETARVEREPVSEPVADAELGASEIEVPLHAEQPVVDKQTVAKERISVKKGVETRPETVTEEVRKEQVEIEGDDVERG